MTDKAVSPLRRRMIEDMSIRKFAPKTQASYICAVRDFSIFLGCPPDRASAEDLRQYQLHLASSGGSATISTASGLQQHLDSQPPAARSAAWRW
jgi:hypothetical protein